MIEEGKGKDKVQKIKETKKGKSRKRRLQFEEEMDLKQSEREIKKNVRTKKNSICAAADEK